jgi:hypothetical protein
MIGMYRLALSGHLAEDVESGRNVNEVTNNP